MIENEDAIQQDAPEQLPARLSAMDLIADRLYGDRLGEDSQEEEQEVEEVEEQEPPAPIEPPPEPKVKVKVDGEEMELPIAEVVKGYQKDQTASRRLEEAARLRQQLELERQAFLQERESLLQKQAAPVEDPVEKYKAIYNALMLGDEESGIKAISELDKGRASDPIPVDQVAYQAAERARVQIEYNLAQRKFAEDYKDISNDSDLTQIAMSYLQQTAPLSSSYDEAFKKAGDLTRKWVEDKAAKFGFAPKVESTQSKTELKQSLDNVKPVNARTAAPREEREPTPSEIIAEMRKKRGLS